MSGILFLLALSGILAVAFWSIRHDSMRNVPQSGLFAIRPDPDERAKHGPNRARPDEPARETVNDER